MHVKASSGQARMRTSRGSIHSGTAQHTPAHRVKAIHTHTPAGTETETESPHYVILCVVCLCVPDTQIQKHTTHTHTHTHNTHNTYTYTHTHTYSSKVTVRPRNVPLVMRGSWLVNRYLHTTHGDETR